MTPLRIPEHATVAHLKGLLMQFPCSVRLKRKLKEAEFREEREKQAQERRLRGKIRKALKGMPLVHLRALEAEVQQMGSLAS